MDYEIMPLVPDIGAPITKTTIVETTPTTITTFTSYSETDKTTTAGTNVTVRMRQNGTDVTSQTGGIVKQADGAFGLILKWTGLKPETEYEFYVNNINDTSCVGTTAAGNDIYASVGGFTQAVEKVYGTKTPKKYSITGCSNTEWDMKVFMSEYESEFGKMTKKPTKFILEDRPSSTFLVLEFEDGSQTSIVRTGGLQGPGWISEWGYTGDTNVMGVYGPGDITGVDEIDDGKPQTFLMYGGGGNNNKSEPFTLTNPPYSPYTTDNLTPFEIGELGDGYVVGNIHHISKTAITPWAPKSYLDYNGNKVIGKANRFSTGESIASFVLTVLDTDSKEYYYPFTVFAGWVPDVE